MEVIAKTKKVRVSRKVEPNPNEVKFNNTKEDLEFLRGNREFFEGLRQLSDRFYQEVKAFGEQYKTEINSTVSFKIG